MLACIISTHLLDAQPLRRSYCYRPEGQAIVCTNGNNRFTRALYGRHTAYRLETSDRPEFAVTDGKKGRHIQLVLIVDGKEIPLEAAENCKASYEAGRRDYVIRDSRIGTGELHLSALCLYDSDGALLKFDAHGMSCLIEARLRPFKNKSLVRGGDIGSFAKTDRFHPDLEAHPSVTSASIADGLSTYIIIKGEEADTGRYSDLWRSTDNARTALSSTIRFSTPDPYLNTIGANLVMAADGAWDGTVWNHGAVGWRNPLPGWRAAYVGDMLGMFDRQHTHFDAYSRSQVTDVPATRPHLMDESNNLARGAYEWGTPLYSNGYICRNPNRNDQFHHYDMNLVYVDQLLRHFQFDADTAYMRQMWPLLQRHLAWERLAFDPDGDHLYDAYCCIWASDALQYNSGAVTHSSAYNYYANRQAALIAQLLGEDPTPYQSEADAILQAMNSHLWLADQGHWAEFRDFMGNRLVHPDAALWSIYTPIDCEACTPQQAYEATTYIDRHIPHIPFVDDDGILHTTISTSDWQPYEWSINNVAMAEVMHTALAYYKAGRADAAFALLRGSILDFMYMGSSPGNFGQLSAFDAATGEGYRDFSDVTGITSRALIEGLYGITHDALHSQCIIRPGFPSSWSQASIHTPYLDYTFVRRDGKDTYTISQHLPKPLTIVLRQNLGRGAYRDTVCSADSVLTITLPSVIVDEPEVATTFDTGRSTGCDFDDIQPSRCRPVDISSAFNANITDIFQNRYLTPRSPYTTLSLPTQGIGDWCSTKRTAHIDDHWLRTASADGTVHLLGIPFLTPSTGENIIYTSLWDNYPDSISLPLQGHASHAYLIMAGSTNPMQSHITNAIVTVEYTDGTADTLTLTNPDNWCPIEQDYLDDHLAFRLPVPRPYRLALQTGTVSRDLRHPSSDASFRSSDLPNDKRPAYTIPGGAAQIYDMPLDPHRRLHHLTITTVANDVVIGLIGVTLQKLR